MEDGDEREEFEREAAFAATAAARGDVATLGELIDSPGGARIIRHRDARGQTLLHSASHNASLRACELLLQAGADARARDWLGVPASFYGLHLPSGETAAGLRRARALFAAGGVTWGRGDFRSATVVAEQDELASFPVPGLFADLASLVGLAVGPPDSSWEVVGGKGNPHVFRVRLTLLAGDEVRRAREAVARTGKHPSVSRAYLSEPERLGVVS